jgi:hypothetical protein
MKDQYFGDINDYRKYGLLRSLAGVSGLRIGICWLLTPDDAGSDGDLRAYLNNPGKWRRYDPELYESLRRLLEGSAGRSVRNAHEWGLVPGAEYFEHVLGDNAEARAEYFYAAWEQLAGCQLLFFDPDNGIEVPSHQWGTRGSSKYVYWRELKESFSRGHSLLIYQHYPRVPRDQFVPFLAERIGEELDRARVSAFKTPYVASFLVEQPEHAQALEGAAAAIVARWSGQMEPWPQAPSD